MCSWVETQQLFHEHSALAEASVRSALGQGIMQPAPAHTYVPVTGCETLELRVAVQHELLHENVRVSVGRLNISTVTEPGSAALPAYTFSQTRSSLLSNVPVIQLACVHEDLTFALGVRMFPRCEDTAFSQCFEQVDDECLSRLQHTQLASTQLEQPTRTLSHRNFRVACQAAHRRNLLAKGLEEHTGVFTERQVLDRMTSMLSSSLAARGRTHAVHTVFFH